MSKPFRLISAPDPVVAIIAPAVNEARHCVDSVPGRPDAQAVFAYADAAYACAARKTPTTLEGVATLAAALLAAAPWADLVDDAGNLNFTPKLARSASATLDAGLNAILRGLALHGAAPAKGFLEYVTRPAECEAILACLPGHAA